jgi:hypothetical protein
MTTYAPTSSESYNVRAAAQLKSTYITDGTNCSSLSYVRGEQLSDITFQSTEGELSDIEEPSSSSPISSSALLPNTNPTTPTFGLTRPTVVLSSTAVASMENVSECFLSIFFYSFWPIIHWLSPLLLLLSLSHYLALTDIGRNPLQRTIPPWQWELSCGLALPLDPPWKNPRVRKRKRSQFAFVQRERTKFRSAQSWIYQVKEAALKNIPWEEDTSWIYQVKEAALKNIPWEEDTSWIYQVKEAALKNIPWEEDIISNITPSTGFSFDPADCLLERLDPLDYYRRFSTFTSSSFLSTKKESSMRKQVLVAAADLKATIEMGKEPTKLKYHGGTIFVDQASSFIYLGNQTSLRAGETLQSKFAFERFAHGNQISEWNPRSKRGMFVGVSNAHSSIVGRILNVRTGNVSSQYHVVYDDLFTTVPNADSGGVEEEMQFNPKSCLQVLETGWERLADPIDQASSGSRFVPSLDREWLSDDELPPSASDTATDPNLSNLPVETQVPTEPPPSHPIRSSSEGDVCEKSRQSDAHQINK